MSRFFCDTNCEIDLETFKSLNIELIRMPYTVDSEQIYYDLGENTDFAAFFNKMRKGASVKTQALNEYDYIEYFEPVLRNGEDIIYVSFSHKLSGTFDSARKAIEQLKEKYPDRKITIVNSKKISIPAGMIVHEAAKMHNAGATDAQVAEFVESFSNRAEVYFTVDSLEYLRRGGRLTKFKFIFGTLLSVKPIISIDQEGRLVNTEAVKGRKLAIKRLLTLLKDNPPDLNYKIYLLNADCAEETEPLKEMILNDFPDARIFSQSVGPVIGCHCGPGTIGLCYIKKGGQ